MNNVNGFKVGDKVRLKANFKSTHPAAFHERLVVDMLLQGSPYVGVKTENGNEAGFFPSELEADGFRVGDRVEFTENYDEDAKNGDRGTVTLVIPKERYGDDADLVHVKLDKGGNSAAFAFRMQHAPAVVAVEQEPEPQPVTYRICVNNQIGTTEYPSQAAAEQAAILHGKDGETFSIFECVLIADYRVKVTKSLEAVDAAD
jgi:hypothetical protein